MHTHAGLGLEEVPDYDLDSEDEEWLNAQSNERVSAASVCTYTVCALYITITLCALY